MIDIVVVNWNSGHQINCLLRSVDAHGAGVVDRVIIVDNASVDDSLVGVEGIGIDCCEIEVVRNEANLGFGVACNQGANRGCGKYILFLNPDAELFSDSLPKAVEFMERAENEGVGVCGVQLIDEDRRITRSCARFPTPWMFTLMALGLDRLSVFSRFRHHMTDWDHKSTGDVDHVIGAFYLIRRELFESVGGFDDRFFVYLEDLDLSLRVRQSGRKIVYLADAQAFHAGGGTSRQIKAKRLFYSLRSRLLYGFKHFSPLGAWWVAGMTIVVEPFSRLAFSLVRGSISDVRNTIEGYLMFLRTLPSTLRSAKR